MHKIIPNAIVYKAELPTAAQLAKHLAELPYAPIGETMLSRPSFVPNKISNELVTEFNGGFAFHLRYDEKILPKAIVKAKAAERIAAIEERNGGRMKKIERIAIYEQVHVELAKTALVKTAIIPAFYRTNDQMLIVATGSKSLANTLVHYLIHVVGSVKTTTINISDIKNGLTTRLKKHLVDGGAFEGFVVGTTVALKNGGQKVSYSLSNLDTASQGLIEAIDKGFQVERLALEYNDVEFKLTSDFHFKAVRFDDVESDDDALDAVAAWQHDASVQTLQFTSALNELCNLLGYQPEEDGEQASA
ncbi:hypothetical protein K32_49080 [Kaistia sp. 32K]|uniref:recombination-associated protein RdgC n=1 Tax=Kaistia sp. 32K TaxID=2795690 RepID=UPI001915C03C|nr:recombination-associated protein RdgC [Kaistia sp. 32K]BCP56291.1 hypothetical protein K32_49080 [Kaistia sp. 32K]